MKKIEKIPDENPFKVPDNYFEEVNRRIIMATAGDTPPVKETGIFRRLRPYILTAASVTGFILLSYVAVRYFRTDIPDSGSGEIYAANYAESYINEIDLFTLEESASVIDLPDYVSGIINSDIIDYLILENIEISEIYEQL